MKYLVVLLLAVFLIACGPTEPAAINTDKVAAAPPLVTEEAPEFADLFSQAEAVFAESKAAGHAWSVSADRLRDARQAEATGDQESAIANANEAIKLSRLSLVQAEAEVNLWQQRVPK